MKNKLLTTIATILALSILSVLPTYVYVSCNVEKPQLALDVTVTPFDNNSIK